MHLVLSGNLPDRLDAHQGFQSDFGLKGTRVSFAFSSFAHGSAVLSRSAEPEKSNLGYCPKFGVHFKVIDRSFRVTPKPQRKMRSNKQNRKTKPCQTKRH